VPDTPKLAESPTPGAARRHGVVPGRATAEVDGEVVVFLIGMRVNRPWKLAAWIPTAAAMAPMLRHLAGDPDSGLLGYQAWALPSPLLVMYWRSFEDLGRFARDQDAPHLEPWRRYNRKVGASGDVGVWHETYRVPVGHSESVYANMPVFGLAGATRHRMVGAGRQSAAARMGVTTDDEPAVPAPA